MIRTPDKTQAVENHRFDDKRPNVNKNADYEIVPLLGKVYVEPDFGPTQTDSGFLLEKQRKTAIPNSGWILCLGEDVGDLFVGDYVIFDDVQSKGFWAKGVAHIPLNREQIIAIIGDKRR